MTADDLLFLVQTEFDDAKVQNVQLDYSKKLDVVYKSLHYTTVYVLPLSKSLLMLILYHCPSDFSSLYPLCFFHSYIRRMGTRFWQRKILYFLSI